MTCFSKFFCIVCLSVECCIVLYVEFVLSSLSHTFLRKSFLLKSFPRLSFSLTFIFFPFPPGSSVSSSSSSSSSASAAIPAMIAAFYPKFPTHSNDNRYHLQALRWTHTSRQYRNVFLFNHFVPDRHLYVLAVEPRLLSPVDADSRSVSIRATNNVFFTCKMFSPIFLGF